MIIEISVTDEHIETYELNKSSVDPDYDRRTPVDLAIDEKIRELYNYNAKTYSYHGIELNWPNEQTRIKVHADGIVWSKEWELQQEWNISPFDFQLELPDSDEEIEKLLIKEYVPININEDKLTECFRFLSRDFNKIRELHVKKAFAQALRNDIEKGINSKPRRNHHFLGIEDVFYNGIATYGRETNRDNTEMRYFITIDGIMNIDDYIAEVDAEINKLLVQHEKIE